MEERRLFSNETLQKTRKTFLKFAVWILIAELVFGAILILTGSWDIAIGKVQGTFLILALILFVGVNNFIRIEKGDRATQIFALISFIGNLIWGLFALVSSDGEKLGNANSKEVSKNNPGQPEDNSVQPESNSVQPENSSAQSGNDPVQSDTAQ